MQPDAIQSVDYSGYVVLVIALIALYSIFYALWVQYQNKLIREMAKTGVLLEVVLEKDTETEHLSVEQMWSNFHSGLFIPWYKRLTKAQPYLSFEIKSEHASRKAKKEVTINFWVPEEYKSLIQQRVLGLYPKAQITVLEEDYLPTAEDRLRVVETARLGLRGDSAFAIRLLKDFKTDPLSSITASMINLEDHELASLQVLVRPVSPKWRAQAERTLVRYEKTGKKPGKIPQWAFGIQQFLLGFFAFAQSMLNALFQSTLPEGTDSKGGSKIDSEKQKEMLEKVTRNPFEFEIRVLVATPFGKEVAKEKMRNIVSALKELDGPYNGLKKYKVRRPQRLFEHYTTRFMHVLNNDDILTSVELAGFAHLPEKTNFTPGLKKIQSKRTEFPADVATDDPFAVAVDTYGNQKPVGLHLDGRMRHIYVGGMTGVGKSTLLENMLIRDIENGKSVVLVDPHGELVDVVLEKISTDRSDVFVLDPSDIGYPFGLNLLEVSSEDPLRREMEKVLVVDAYITVMKRVFGEASIGANTDDLFRMSCAAILETPDGGGLLEMLLMLTSDVYRARVLEFVRDPVVKNYWEVVYPALAGQGKFLVQNLNAPLNKIRRFIANGLVANIICQKKSTLNIADTMNSGGVILARFSRGDMGFENSALLGKHTCPFGWRQPSITLNMRETRLTAFSSNPAWKRAAVSHNEKDTVAIRRDSPTSSLLLRQAKIGEALNDYQGASRVRDEGIVYSR